jgi:hypothetical protein
MTSLLLLLFNWIANGVLPDGSGTTIKHNTQKHSTQNNTTLKQNTAHQAKQTIKDDLHNNKYNTKKIKMSL